MQIRKSHNANDVLNRMKKLLRVKTDLELSKLLDVRPNTLSTWKKRDSLDYSTIIELCKLYKIDLNQVFMEGKGAKALPDHFREVTPFISRNILHEYIMGGFEDNLEDLPSYHFPFIASEESRVFQIPTNNMFPLIEENSFALCERISISNIRDNNIAVVISKRKGFFLNRMIKKEEGTFLLLNENHIPHEEDSLEIHINDIDELWLVKGILFALQYC